MVANAWLSPGNTAASSNCEAFMDETFDILRDHNIALIRADSRFYCDKILSHLEHKDIHYIISAKAYANIKGKIYGLKQWIGICDGIDVAEFIHQPLKGTARRHIVVRKLIARRDLTVQASCYSRTCLNTVTVSMPNQHEPFCWSTLEPLQR